MKYVRATTGLSKLFYDNDTSIDIHVTIHNDEYQILSTIIDYKISYTKTLI